MGEQSEPGKPQASIGQQIQLYGGELLSEMQVDPLITFAEEYLEAGALLTELHRQQLHRLLAIGYAVRKDQYQALAHLQKSNLQREELDKVQKDLWEMDVGALSKR